MKTKTLAVTLLVAAFFTNCASWSKDKKRSYMRSAEAPKADNISILPIDIGGARRTFVFNEVKNIMFGNGLDIVDRGSVAGLLGENELNLAGLTEESNRIKLGKLANVNTVGLLEYEYTANMTRLSVNFLNLETGKYYYTFDLRNKHNKQGKNKVLRIVFYVSGAAYLLASASYADYPEEELFVLVGSSFSLSIVSLLTMLFNWNYEDRKMESFLKEFEQDLKNKWPQE